MEIDKTNLVYRQKVTGFIFNSDKKVLLIQKLIYSENDWDFPGGGVDEGETEEVALLRELIEELGTDKFELVQKSEIKNKYEFPDKIIQEQLVKGKNYRGQESTQFIVKFLGYDSDIKIEETIRRYKWASLEDLGSLLLFEGQFDNAKSVLETSKYLNL